MNKNICKFITQSNSEILYASNFIYEQECKESGKERVSNENTMYMVSGGNGFFRSLNKVHRLTNGTVFFSFADIPFTIESTDSLKYYYIAFTGGRARDLFYRFGITPENFVFYGYERLVPFWQESLVRANEENIDLLSESVLLYTFSKLKKANVRKDVVSEALEYIESNFTKNSITLTGVADMLGYNPKYFSHTFKKEFGMGFNEYLRLLRIRHAVMLIENGVTSVKNIAALCGYSDPLYFSKVFTATVGVSPKQYKK